MSGQTEKIGQLFKLKSTLQVNYLNKITGVSPDTINKKGDFYVKENVIYRIQSVDVINDKLIFYALDYNQTTNSEDKGTNNDKAFYYNDKLLEMKLSDYKSYAFDVEIADRVSFGILTLPFKYRLQKGASFENKLNLNTVISLLLNSSLNQNTKIYAQFGAGFGTVNLNTDNAPKITAGTTEDIETITGFGGIMFEYKKIQTGIYLGFDKINNNNKYDWQSQGKPWISLGIGFKIFTISKDNADNKIGQ